MKEERIMILNLLNEGKISADEAAKLLDALGKAGGGEGKKFKYHRDFSDFGDADERDVEEKLKKFSQAVDNFSKEFGGKVSETFKEFEPKLKKTAKTVMEKTASVVDDLARALNESVKNMEEKMKASCEDDCCDDDDCCCCDDEPKEN